MNSTPPPDLDPVALEAAEQAFLNYCDIDCSQIGWQSPDERKRLAAAIRAWEAKKWRPEREREREREAPTNLLLTTWKEGEIETSKAWLRVHPDGDREWISLDGRTTVTHHSYAAPTHFYLDPPRPDPENKNGKV